MAVILGVTYPDLFTAVGAAAGPEYQAGTTPTFYFTGGPDPKTIGDLAYNVMGSYAREVPVIDFQGSADIVCPPINGDQVIQSWMQTDHDANSAYNADYAHPATTTAGQVPGGHSYTTLTWNDDNGNEVEEQWKVDGMGHAWGGGTGLFGDPEGPDMTQAVYNFFMRFSN